MKFTKKQLIKEVLGVPEGLIEASEQIYNDFLQQFKKVVDEPIEYLETHTIKLPKEYRILDVEIKGVEIDFFVFKTDKVDSVQILGMSEVSSTRMSPDYNLIQVKKPEILLKIKLAVPEDATTQQVYDKFETDKSYSLASFSHEIKHYIDGVKKPTEKHSERVKYAVSTDLGFGDVEPLNNLLFSIYFISTIENLVRPTEVAHLLKLNKVKKENFVDFITSDKTFQSLKQIQKFTYKDLKENLKDYIPNIKYLFEMNNIEFEGMTDEQLIKEALRLFYVNLANNLGEKMKERLVTNPFELFVGFVGDKDAFFRRFIGEVTKYQNNIDGFYLAQEKKFQRVATKMIKKLSKLYAHPVVGEQTIKDPKLWYKIVAKPMKLETEFKFGKKNLNEMSPHSTGIQEFIQSVKEVPGLLQHLGFPKLKSLEEYLEEANVNDFYELKKEVEEFFKKQKKKK